jgi:putative ATP-dependent endonuclease of OLD family
MGLLDAYGIPHGVMLDDDNGKEHQGAVNDLVEASANGHTLAPPVKFVGCLEAFLGLPVPAKDKKPIEILKAITGGLIGADKLTALRVEFCKALAIP